MDLGYVRTLKKVTIGCLQNQNSWIFFPKTVAVSVSQDGKNYSVRKRIEWYATEQDNNVFIKDFSVTLNGSKGRYIRIKAENVGKCPEWHKGAGGKAWVFIDEIMVE